MIDNACYIIKKTKFGKKPIPIYGGIFLPIVYIIISIMMIIPLYFDYAGDIDTEDFIGTLIIPGFVMIYGIYLLLGAVKIKKINNLKNNGGCIIKKAKVTSIQKLRANKGKGNKIDVYYVEAEEGGVIYYSNGYTKGVLLGTSISELQGLYIKYGFNFDERQTQKDAVLRKIDELIAEKENVIENSKFISRFLKKRKLGELSDDKKILLDGYTPPYWQVNGNKITVGDTVDIYLDPNDSEKYLVDLDFLFYENHC